MLIQDKTRALANLSPFKELHDMWIHAASEVWTTGLEAAQKWSNSALRQKLWQEKKVAFAELFRINAT